MMNNKPSTLAAPDFVIVSSPRSGTHFLESALASHPRIHGRGECVLRFCRSLAPPSKYVFINKPGHLNGAIVMYAQIRDFEQMFGSIHEFKAIHLLRNPRDAALSRAQKESDRKLMGAKYKAHRRMQEGPQQHTSISAERVNEFYEKIKKDQEVFRKFIEGHPNLLEVTYEDLTNNSQVHKLAEEPARRLLSFLGVPYKSLTTTLRKTAPSVYKFDR